MIDQIYLSLRDNRTCNNCDIIVIIGVSNDFISDMKDDRCDRNLVSSEGCEGFRGSLKALEQLRREFSGCCGEDCGEHETAEVGVNEFDREGNEEEFITGAGLQEAWVDLFRDIVAEERRFCRIL